MADAIGRRFLFLTVAGREADDFDVGVAPRDHLVDILPAAIGPAWCDREEAIVAAARHLGFRRTGRNIRTAFKSAINTAIRRGLIETDGPSRIRRLWRR